MEVRVVRSLDDNQLAELVSRAVTVTENGLAKAYPSANEGIRTDGDKAILGAIAAAVFTYLANAEPE